MKSFRRWCANGALVLGSVLVCGAACEMGLRLVDVRYDAALHTGDRDRGWAFRPRAEGWFVQEGRDYVRINSDGLRDREHAVEKPEGAIRIAVVGDSFSAALQLPMEKAYWSVLERGLAGCEGAPVEVINFGVGGYSTVNELMTLRKHVWKYQPDVVLLQVYLGNDVVDNSKALKEEDNPNRPFLRYEGEELVLDDAFRVLPQLQPGAVARSNLFADLANGSRLLLGLYNARLGLLGRKGRGGAPGDGLLAFEMTDRERMIYAPPTDPAFADAWRITEGAIRQFRDEVAEGGATMWMVSLSMPAQVWPDEAARERFAGSMSVPDLFYPDDRLEALAAREGIRHLALARPMAAHADRTGDVLHGFVDGFHGAGHWNEKGHRVGGSLLTEQMCAARMARRSVDGDAHEP